MLIRFLDVVPKRDAIPLRESPRTTVYVETGAGAAGAAGAASGAGAAGAAGAPTSRSVPFSKTNLPTRADIASPTGNALTWDPVIEIAFAQFNPQAAISSQFANGSLWPLCIKK